MKLKNTMIIVTDINKSVEFYKNILELNGANKTLTGNLVLQTKETYKYFIDNNDIYFVGNYFEIYFEEYDFDKFINKLKNYNMYIL